MFLEEFSATQVQRDAGTVFSAASEKPILIRRQKRAGKDIGDMVMMSKEAYSELVSGNKTKVVD